MEGEKLRLQLETGKSREPNGHRENKMRFIWSDT